MAFDENLAARIRTALTRKKGIEEKKMFGGLCFLLHGHMLVGVWKNSLIARIGQEQSDEAMLEPNVKALDISGKPMRGWIIVEPDGVAGDGAVKRWMQQEMNFVGKLPAK